MPDLFTLRPTKFVPASSLKMMNAPLSERPTLALTLSDISSRDCRDSESLLPWDRAYSLPRIVVKERDGRQGDDEGQMP